MKVKNYTTFWAILGIYAAVVPLTYLAISQISNIDLLPSKSLLLSFPTVWQYFTWTASWWNVMLGVLIVILVCNDFTYKTHRQSVIDGLSRRDVILGKFYFIIALAAVVATYSFVVAAIIGISYSSVSNFGTDIWYVGIYFVQTIGYFAFAFMFAVLVKRPALSIIFYIVIIAIDIFLYNENVMSHHAQFFPTITISELTPNPFYSMLVAMERAASLKAGIPYEEPPNMDQLTRTGLALVYIGIMITVGYVVVRRRDL